MYNFIIVNADTDSIMVSKPDGNEFTNEEQEALIKELNDMFPEHINWDEDGYFDRVVVIKAKNYALKESGSDKVKLKGSSIKDQKKEPALREMMDKMIDAMIFDKQDTLVSIYTEYIKEAIHVQDIRRWCQKKTITESVMDCGNPKNKVRKNEKDVWDAIKNLSGIQQGDKAYVYPVVLGENIIPGGVSEKTGKPLKDKVEEITGLRLDSDWTGDHDVDKLIDRVYKTVCIFKSVLNMEQFIDYSKKKNKPLLESLKNG
jgi:DNA polymerase elongation subunit (family B)